MVSKRACVLVWLLAAVLLLAGCGRPDEEAEMVPLFPLAAFQAYPEVFPFRVPITVHDEAFHFVGYEADGERYSRIGSADLFPTDVLIVFTADLSSAQVFLARSPHAGCALSWAPEEEKFLDPCTGSQFTVEGRYIQGPSPRDMDRLLAEVREDLLWIEPRIIYGESHP